MIVNRKSCLRCDERIRPENIDKEKKLYKCGSCDIVSSIMTEVHITKNLERKIPEGWSIEETNNEVKLKMTKTMATPAIIKGIAIAMVSLFTIVPMFFFLFPLWDIFVNPYNSADLPNFGGILIMLLVLIILVSYILSQQDSEIIIDHFNVKVRFSSFQFWNLFQHESYMIDQVLVNNDNLYIYTKDSDQKLVFNNNKMLPESSLLFIKAFMDQSLNLEDRAVKSV